MLDLIQSVDSEIILFIQNHLRTWFLDPIMVLMAYSGQVGAIWIIISLILMIRKKHRLAGIYTLIGMGLCYILNDVIIKELVQRPRPFETIPGLTVLGFTPISRSFPSGHACSSFAAALMLTKFLGKKGALFYILAVTIAVSRPYIGVHYVSDIIVGAVVGTLGSMVIFAIYRKAGFIKPENLKPI